MDAKKACDTVVENRKLLIGVAFPYLETKKEPPSKADYDRYFDELDDYLAKHGNPSEKPAEKTDEVGETGQK